ncbi:Cell cycle checkpoint control protein rad9b, partial [Cladochytrium tenue]
TVTNIFKQKTNLDSTEKCRIHVDSGEATGDRLIVQLHCRFGVKKTHKLHFEPCDAVQALYAKEQCSSRWTVAPKIIHDWLGFFSNRLEEITAKCGPNWVLLKSFSDEGDEGDKRSLHTELTLDPEDFDSYHVDEPTDVTFSMKDLKTVLGFAEALAQPVTAYFDGPG